MRFLPVLFTNRIIFIRRHVSCFFFLADTIKTDQQIWRFTQSKPKGLTHIYKDGQHLDGLLVAGCVIGHVSNIRHCSSGTVSLDTSTTTTTWPRHRERTSEPSWWEKIRTSHKHVGIFCWDKHTKRATRAEDLVLLWNIKVFTWIYLNYFLLLVIRWIIIIYSTGHVTWLRRYVAADSTTFINIRPRRRPQTAELTEVTRGDGNNHGRLQLSTFRTSLWPETSVWTQREETSQPRSRAGSSLRSCEGPEEPGQVEIKTCVWAQPGFWRHINNNTSLSKTWGSKTQRPHQIRWCDDKGDKQ